MSDIFREVDEEVRHERLKKLWKAYGGYVVGLAAAVVLGVAVNVGWGEYRRSRTEHEGQAFTAAARLVAANKPAEAAKRFASLAEDADTGYRSLARLRQAEALFAAGSIDEAVRVLDALAADDGAEDDLRGLAALAAAYYQADRAPAEEVDRRLEPLVAASSPWRLPALELRGALAYKGGKTARAKKSFTAITEDGAATPAQRDRAAAFLAVLGG